MVRNDQFNLEQELFAEKLPTGGTGGTAFYLELVSTRLLSWIHFVVNVCHSRMILELTAKYGDALGLKSPNGPLY